MLAVGQPLAVAANLAELAAGTAVEAPPDAVGHAVLQAYHCLDHVVHLVVEAHLLILGQLLVELGEVGKRARQLVGVAPIVVLLAGVIPVQGVVVVQRVASHHGDTLHRGIGFQFTCNVGLMILVALYFACEVLFKGVVGLIEGRHADDGMVRILFHPGHMSLDDLRPMVNVGRLVGGVIGIDIRACIAGRHIAVVAVEDQRKGCADNGIKAVGALPEAIYLVGSQRAVVLQGIQHAERRAADAHVLLQHVVDTLLQVLLVNPRHIEAPRWFKALALAIDAERQGNVGLLESGKVKARRRTLPLRKSRCRI